MKIAAALVLLAIAGPASAALAKPPISGTYSNIVKSQASGDLYGHELRLLKVDTYYFAVVIEDDGAPELADVTVTGHHIAFKAADQTWAGDVTAKGSTSSVRRAWTPTASRSTCPAPTVSGSRTEPSMPPSSPAGAWVFVSHSSADLINVRKVRNYLEDHGAAPLLFHLLSLKNQEEFWPVIEREIQERNFFLYCESKAAQDSEFVQMERQAVERSRKLAGGKSIRIGHVRVDSEIDTAVLDDFIEKTRVYPSYAGADRERVKPYIVALEAAGFQVFDPLADLTAGSEWGRSTDSELTETAKKGWVVLFLSRASITSTWAIRETEMSLELGAKIVPVFLDSLDSLGISDGPSASVLLRSGFRESDDAPAALARALYER